MVTLEQMLLAFDPRFLIAMLVHRLTCLPLSNSSQNARGCLCDDSRGSSADKGMALEIFDHVDNGRGAYRGAIRAALGVS